MQDMSETLSFLQVLTNILSLNTRKKYCMMLFVIIRLRIPMMLIVQLKELKNMQNMTTKTTNRQNTNTLNKKEGLFKSDRGIETATFFYALIFFTDETAVLQGRSNRLQQKTVVKKTIQLRKFSLNLHPIKQ